MIYNHYYESTKGLINIELILKFNSKFIELIFESFFLDLLDFV